MTRRRAKRTGGGKADGGAAWISYSDMMAALLLVFVLILCYSVYQYFLMLETKTAELDEKGALLASQEATLTQQQSTLDAQQSTLDKQTLALAEQQAALLQKQNELTSALTNLEEKQGLLDDQNLTLEEQQKIILAAQAALQQKEEELNTAKIDLEGKQKELADATILLGAQQEAMDTQQRRLDDLVGVRTQIIRELSDALTSANLKASVDKNTGDIMLESAVFFDVGKNTIKQSGQELLNQFIPVYLGVLLEPAYASYLGEIIIEGHTDTQGDYLMNLKLSQERALSVATYCLQLPSLSESQLEVLRGILTAKGRSFSNPIYNDDGSIDMDSSRRVEFKFRMKDSEMIDEIRNILKDSPESEVAAQ
ncbi:MAG: OmpA family protein [Eubacteriales bacterium]|nr:OmpA family protein [Eubacteriales bacterium]